MDAESKIITLDQLVELAMESDVQQELPWSSVNIEAHTAYSMMAAHVIDLFDEHKEADREIVMMSVMTKLLVENLLLNLKIHQNNN